MLANNRTPSAIRGIKKLSNSTATKKGIIGSGTPPGSNKLKNFRPCSLKPTNNLPTQTIRESEKVRIKCDVIVKLYGTRPITFPSKRKQKSANIKGKKVLSFGSYIFINYIQNKSIQSFVYYLKSCRDKESFIVY
jgi:hypothetical protein